MSAQQCQACTGYQDGGPPCPVHVLQQCAAELCRNWTGQGCACEFLGLAPDVVDEGR